MTPEELEETAAYIWEWLRRRNGSELSEALGEISVNSRERLHLELIEIIKAHGRPRNWAPF